MQIWVCRADANEAQISVLMINVGPKSFKKLSDICQKSVRKLSVAKISQNSVRNVSEFCQKTVRCKFVSEISQKTFRNLREMYQFLKMCQKTVCLSLRKKSEMCQKSVWKQLDANLCQKLVKKDLEISQICISSWICVRKQSFGSCGYQSENNFLTHYWPFFEWQTDSFLTHF